MTITEFLLARIAEDESGEDAQLVGSTRKDWTVRWAAECEAKRRIVESCTYAEWGTPAFRMAREHLEHLAAVYADHPDYDEAWRP